MLLVWALVADPSDETNVRTYIAVGKGVTGAVAMLATLWALLSHIKAAPGQGTFDKLRDRIQQQIDDDKTSNGPGSFGTKLGAAMEEEALYLFCVDDP
jgi:hypothetical protein